MPKVRASDSSRLRYAWAFRKRTFKKGRCDDLSSSSRKEGTVSDLSGTPEAKFSESFGSELIQPASVHLNLKQEVIIVTGDKLELCLRKHMGCVAAKGSWITPVSLFVTFVASLVASTFHDALGLKAPVWEAMFWLLAIGSFIWLVYCIGKAFRIRTSLDTLLKEIKKASDILRENK
jgi:hypothetical protein